MAEVSGRAWCARFCTSTSLDDLVEPFRGNAKRFKDAIEDGGGHVAVSATWRPQERAYLMHWCWMIARGDEHGVHARGIDVPVLAGVAIQWWRHDDPTYAAERAAAEEMVQAYAIKYPPSLTSRHILRRAIDMTITWAGVLRIRNAKGTLLSIASEPRNGQNPELWKIGAEYGVIKLPSDRPHWSDDGH